MKRRAFLQNAAMMSAGWIAGRSVPAWASMPEGGGGKVIEIHVDKVIGQLPHVWEKCVGSDRAVVALRSQWLSDLEVVRKAIGIKSVRFHGLFNDEMGVWPSGAKQPNFLYVDMIFDALLDRGIRPFVELSFMPTKLASGTRTLLWYRGNTTPPSDPAVWGELVESFGRHCVQRYGAQEVRNWGFEVWNEPNIVFWAGTQADYFELYRRSVVALKKVDSRLRVGGPSTARAAWVPELLAFCAKENLPVDFASTHIYPDDPQKVLFGEGAAIPYEQVIPSVLKKLNAEIKASSHPELPLYISEWSSQNPAFIAQTIRDTVGLSAMMSYWTFSNVYEEMGVPKSFLNSGFGLLGMRGVPRPSFNTFVLLHKLGRNLVESESAPVLASQRDDGSTAILLWNLIPRVPEQKSSMGDPLQQQAGEEVENGSALTVPLRISGLRSHRAAKVTYVDATNRAMKAAYEKMGQPAYPTEAQIEEFKSAAALPASRKVPLSARGELAVTVPPNGVALVEID